MDNLEFHDLVAKDRRLISDGTAERCSTLSQIIRLKASVEHWLVEPILDTDKEHGEVFRYMQLANTAYSVQCKNDILRTLMNYMASYETK